MTTPHSESPADQTDALNAPRSDAPRPDAPRSDAPNAPEAHCHPRPGPSARVCDPVQIQTAFVQLYIVTETTFAPSPSANAPRPRPGRFAEAADTYIAFYGNDSLGQARTKYDGRNKTGFVLHPVRVRRCESVVPFSINSTKHRPPKSPAFQRSSKHFKGKKSVKPTPPS